MNAGRTSIAAVIWAKDSRQQIAECVRAVAQLPGIDPIIVCADGSSDDTAAHAAAAGAIVVRHDRPRGWAASMESAVNALGILEARDGRSEARLLLLLCVTDTERMVAAGPRVDSALIEPVRTGAAALTLAAPPNASTEASLPSTAAGRGIAELIGWSPTAPLSTLRCLSRRAFELTSPLAAGWGGAVSMIIDISRAGLEITEVELGSTSGRAGVDLGMRLDQAVQLAEITRALAARGLVKPDRIRRGLTGLAGEGLSGLVKRFKR